jgi:hybrid cluster-associated redox disulfide protein
MKGERVEQQARLTLSNAISPVAYVTDEAQRTYIADLTVADLLGIWPQAAPVFVRHRLACVGCSLARFDRISDVASNYGLDLCGLVDELRRAMEIDKEYVK